MLNTRVMGCCMDLANRSIEVENGMAVSSVWAVPSAYDPDRGTALILAHGAGADMNHEFMVDFQSRLTEAGNLTIPLQLSLHGAGTAGTRPASTAGSDFSSRSEGVSREQSGTPPGCSLEASPWGGESPPIWQPQERM